MNTVHSYMQVRGQEAHNECGDTLPCVYTFLCDDKSSVHPYIQACGQVRAAHSDGDTRHHVYIYLHPISLYDDTCIVHLYR